MANAPIRRALILDVDDAFSGDLAEVLTDANYEVFRARDRATAQRILTEKKVLALLLGMSPSREDSLEDLRWVKLHFPCVEVVVFNNRDHFRAAFDTMNLGAFDFLVKSANMLEFIPVIDKALDKSTENFRSKLSSACAPRLTAPATEMVGSSAAIQNVQARISKIAPSDAPVMISGETGVGKELAARMIHRLSRRSSGPFVPINCGAIPESLLENELFGHAKGAFTDSGQVKLGLLEEADGGTLFLDEVSELTPALQAKLLRVLEAGTFRRLGDNKERHIDVRFIAAGNRDLKEEMNSKRMRADFYYRLAVLLIDIPPLRKRRDDIPLLVEHFFTLHLSAHKVSGKKISTSAMRMLMEYDWPGNVRETRNVVERLAILADDKIITPADIINIVDLSYGMDLPTSSPEPPTRTSPGDRPAENSIPPR